VLQKLKVLGEGQTASAEDQQIAEQKVCAAHASIRKDERVRWTINDLPEAAEEPYVFMAAFLAGDAFGAPVETLWWTWGEREITALVATPGTGQAVRTEYF
jgi:hypothetical protein